MEKKWTDVTFSHLVYMLNRNSNYSYSFATVYMACGRRIVLLIVLIDTSALESGLLPQGGRYPPPLPKLPFPALAFSLKKSPKKMCQPASKLLKDEFTAPYKVSKVVSYTSQCMHVCLAPLQWIALHPNQLQIKPVNGLLHWRHLLRGHCRTACRSKT